MRKYFVKIEFLTIAYLILFSVIYVFRGDLMVLVQTSLGQCLSCGDGSIPTPTPEPTPESTPPPVPPGSGGGSTPTEPPSSDCNATVPGEVANVFAEAVSSTQVRIKWLPPSNAPQAKIAYAESEGKWIDWLTTENDGVFTSNLPSSATRFWFRVAGVNDCAVGPWSAQYGPVTFGVAVPPGVTTPTPTAAPLPPGVIATPGAEAVPTPMPLVTIPPVSTPDPIEEIRSEIESDPIASQVGEVATTTTEVTALATGAILAAYTTSTLIGAGGAMAETIAVAGITHIGFGSIILGALQALGQSFTNLMIPIFTGLGIFKVKRKSLGIVFDTITSLPLSGAYLVLYSGSGGLHTAVSNNEGRFLVSARPDTYKLRAEKTGYKFPSKIITVPHNHDFAMIYQGQDIVVTSALPVSDIAVPMDPVTPASGIIRALSQASSKLAFFVQRYHFPILLTLLALVILATILIPSPLNIYTLIVISSIFVISTVHDLIKFRTWGVILDAKTGKPVAHATVKLYKSKGEREELYLVTKTNGDGRYLFVPEDGEYTLKVYADHTKLLGEKRVTVSQNYPQINQKISV